MEITRPDGGRLMELDGTPEGMKVLLFWVGFFVLAGLVALLFRPEKGPERVHRRGTELLSQEEAQARVDRKGGAG